MTTSIYHYVYRISNIKLNKHYYGVRSCNCHPTKDLGYKYFSSSSDKEFIENQRLKPQEYRYKIVSIKDTREQAVGVEIYLHEKYDVKSNDNFYNKANQTSIGFDASGLKKTYKTIAKTKYTNIKRYGSESPAGNKDIIEKMLNTHMKRYKSGHSSRELEVRLKYVNTCIDRYGVDNVFQSKDIKEISKNTCIDRYGVENYAQTEERRTKISIERTGEPHWMFKGYYVYNGIKYNSITTLSDLLHVPKQRLRMWCLQQNDKIITNRMYAKTPFLNSFGEYVIGKTFKDLGFNFSSL